MECGVLLSWRQRVTDDSYPSGRVLLRRGQAAVLFRDVALGLCAIFIRRLHDSIFIGEEFKMKEEEILTVIHEWKHYWMNQKQNSKEDYENYYRRALGVDANMAHHLADLICEKLKESDDEI